MNPFKKLASQTFIYGIPSIAGRFLNYLLTYLYTRVFSTADFGVNSELYAYSGFFAVLLAFGLETGFFRFRQQSAQPEKVYSTALRFLFFSSAAFTGIALLFAKPIAAAMQYEGNEFYIQIFILILALDALGALPFAKLRAESKAGQFAGIKLIEISVNIGLNIFFLVVCREAFLEQETNFFARCYNPAVGVGYIFISNLVASAVKVMLLLPNMLSIKDGFDLDLLKKMMRYSLPMVIIGFAGIINEMLDRMTLKYLLPFDTQTNLSQLGIYGACYKLSVVMTLFIQAFRYAAEPFFFAQAKQDDSRKIYADVLLYFTIFCVFIFLVVMLFIDFFQLFIGKDFREGIRVVPVLLLANMFLGIYTNLSVWYKLTDRTLSGAWLSIAGSVLTVILLITLIPKFGYMGAAWATFICYASMTLASYFWGQKHFPVPYNFVKVAAYIIGGVATWQLHVFLVNEGFNRIFSAIGLILIFLILTYVFEKKRKTA